MDTAIQVKTQEDSLKAIMRSDEIRGKFAEVIGNNNAAGYISSVLIAVSDSQALQRCTPTSIISAALRAATMRLSVEPSLGHAYLVPFGERCTLVVGYKGIYQMALRTGQYRYLDLITVYDTDTITQNTLSGMHALSRGARSENIVGYLLYFKLNSGFEKTFYMTSEECMEHGRRYSKTFFRNDSLWKTDPEKMCKKTVMRLGLMKWGLFTDVDSHNLAAIDESFGELPDIVDSITISDEPSISSNQAMSDLGYDEPQPTPVVHVSEPEPEKPLVKRNTKKDVMANNGHTRPYDPDVLKAKIADLILTMQDRINKGEAASKDSDEFVITTHIEQVWAGDADAEDKRHAVTEYLVGKRSIKDMTDAEKLALKHWLKITKDEGSGEWVHAKEAGIEAAQVYRQTLVDQGQMTLLD